MFENHCSSCGITYPIDVSSSSCPKCGGMFDLRKDYASLDVKKALRKPISSLWSLEEVLPPLKERVSIGEPLAPIIKHRYNTPTGREVTLYLKNEGLMPTGSFKDRGSAVLVSHMKGIGVREAATDSSGNAGVSMAAYSYVAGIRLKIYTPASISPEKRRVIEIFSAGLEFTATRDEASVKAKGSGLFYANHAWNPIFFEGTKTLLYEAIHQVNRVDAVFIPLGSGTLFLGLMEAIKELREHGALTDDIRVFLVRPVGYELTPETRRASFAEPTIAEGVAIKNLYRRDQILRLIHQNDIEIIYVDNSEIVASLGELIRIGILAEPTGAVPLAGFRNLIKNGDTEFSRVLIPITGSGLKSLEKLHGLLAAQRLV